MELPLECLLPIHVLGRMRWYSFSLAVALAVSLALANLGRSEDFIYWSTINSKQIELDRLWKTASHLQLRSPEMEFLQYGRFSQKFLRVTGDKWTLGVHPAIEFKRAAPGDSWANDYRVEVEASGNFNLSDGATLSTRTRWEFRLKDGSGSEVFHRVRQLFRATWKLEGLGPVDSYAMANEVFYELDQGQIVANRYFPVSIGFKSMGNVKTGAYLMYLSQRSKATDNWSGSYVIGIDFKF